MPIKLFYWSVPLSNIICSTLFELIFIYMEWSWEISDDKHALLCMQLCILETQSLFCCFISLYPDLLTLFSWFVCKLFRLMVLMCVKLKFFGCAPTKALFKQMILAWVQKLDLLKRINLAAFASGLCLKSPEWFTWIIIGVVGYISHGFRVAFKNNLVREGQVKWSNVCSYKFLNFGSKI